MQTYSDPLGDHDVSNFVAQGFVHWDVLFGKFREQVCQYFTRVVPQTFVVQLLNLIIEGISWLHDF